MDQSDYSGKLRHYERVLAEEICEILERLLNTEATDWVQRDKLWSSKCSDSQSDILYLIFKKSL